MQRIFLVLLSLLFALPAMAQTITMGDTAIEAATDDGNGNLILAQQASLSAPGTLISLSFYVGTASGNLLLGVYDATGPSAGPGKLLATTAVFAPVANRWNSQATTAKPVLNAGAYWLVYAPSSNALTFRKQNTSGNCFLKAQTFGALPATFPTGLTSCTPTTWSFYASLNATTVTPPPTVAAPSNSAPPVISVQPAIGSYLLASAGTWNGTINSYSYEWSNGSSVVGAAHDYTAKTSDAGKILSVKVTAKGPGGNTSATTLAAAPVLSITSGGGGGGGGSSRAFVPLHTYFLAPTTATPAGNDGNTGVDAAHPWATPNHAVVCGDVIIAATGQYNTTFTNWGAVSTCPSTTGGIDGTGGIYFATLLCSGNVGTCFINSGSSPTQNVFNFDVNNNNWAIEGWGSTAGYVVGGGTGFGFTINSGNSRPSGTYHVAFINNDAWNNGSGYTLNSEGANSGFGNGADYWAIVGNIAQNSAGRCDGFSDGAIDIIGIKDLDTVAGTHIIVDDNFSYNNLQPNSGTCGPGSGTDGESYLFDSIDGLNYNRQIIFRNNIGAVAQRFSLQFQCGVGSTDTPTIKVYNNTLTGAAFMASANAGAVMGEYNLQSAGSPQDNCTWVIPVTNNIGRTIYATQGNSGTGSIWAMMQGINPGGTFNMTVGGAGTQNVFSGLSSTCDGVFCDIGSNPPYNVTGYRSQAALGTNFYENPFFNNLTDLLSNRIGVPNCTAFTNTTACMGWNALTSTLTTLSVIGDLQPSASGACVTSGHCAGKGYQPPSITCVASDPDFPVWLKGIVYLHWNGTSVEQRFDLVTLPCGL